MAPARNVAQDVVLYGLTRFFLGLLGALPLAFARKLVIALGRVALALLPRLHRVGREQLDAVYGDTLSNEAKQQILRDAMDNISIVAAEFAHGPRLREHGFPGLLIEGIEHVDQSRGGIMISAHQGNWEWLAGACSRGIPKFLIVARPLNYPPMDALVEREREAIGFKTIPKVGAAKRLYEALADGWQVGIMVDQCPRERGVPTTFLGRECWSTIGPAMIAAKAKVPVHFVSMYRQPDGSYICNISPALTLVDTGNALDDLQRNTQMFQDEAEKHVRLFPGQWLWFHRRWKQRPQLAKEWAERVAQAADKG
jgi:KDO2-lipid IV(A) lauroyltransferase